MRRPRTPLISCSLSLSLSPCYRKQEMLGSARQKQQQQLLLLLLVSSSPLAAPLTAATATSPPWRPTPLRASPPPASLSANASALTIQLRYKTWDGNFLDVVELAAGKWFLFLFFAFFFPRRSRASSAARGYFEFCVSCSQPPSFKARHTTTGKKNQTKNRDALLRRARQALGPLSPPAGHGRAPDARGRRQDP